MGCLLVGCTHQCPQILLQIVPIYKELCPRTLGSIKNPRIIEKERKRERKTDKETLSWRSLQKVFQYLIGFLSCFCYFGSRVVRGDERFETKRKTDRGLQVAPPRRREYSNRRQQWLWRRWRADDIEFALSTRLQRSPIPQRGATYIRASQRLFRENSFICNIIWFN